MSSETFSLLGKKTAITPRPVPQPDTVTVTLPLLLPPQAHGQSLDSTKDVPAHHLLAIPIPSA